MYRDTEGKLRWEGKLRTKSNAQTRLSEVLNEIDKGTYSRPSSLSFEQFAKEWLLSRRQLRGSTEAGYSSLIDKQLIPRLGALKVSRVRFEDVDAAVKQDVELNADRRQPWIKQTSAMKISCSRGTKINCSPRERF